MEGLEKIASPTVPVNDIAYETELRTALDPLLQRLLDVAEKSGWDRRKAAYSMMFLAARAMPDSKSRQG